MTFLSPIGIKFSEIKNNRLASLATTDLPVIGVFVFINGYPLYMKYTRKENTAHNLKNNLKSHLFFFF